MFIDPRPCESDGGKDLRRGRQDARPRIASATGSEELYRFSNWLV